MHPKRHSVCGGNFIFKIYGIKSHVLNLIIIYLIMEIYEIQINDRDLESYPTNSKFKELTIGIIERAVNIVYENHFKDLCIIENIEHYSLQDYWIITLTVEETNLQMFRNLLQDYINGNMSHYHCL